MPEEARGAPKSSAGIGSDVFVSYASQDTAVANSIVEALERQGLTCWIAPRNVTPGSLYADEIVGAISDAKAFIVILSEHSVASSHVGREIERAASKRRRIIALRVDSAPLPRAFEYFLSESQWIDLNRDGLDAAAAKLAAAISRHVDPTAASGRSADSAAASVRGPAAALCTKWILAGGIAAVSIALAYFVVDKFWLTKLPTLQSTLSTTKVDDRSIAVLPFLDLSEKKDQDYFADGMAEEILDLLAHLPGLRVIGRTSSFQFKGRTDDLRKIGTALGAEYVVEGSVRKTANRLRITAQLIGTHDGSHVWSETYDDTIDDVLAVQRRISIAVVRALQVTVGADDVQAPTAIKNAQAYELYLKGKHAYDRASKASTESAIAYFQQALELDPTFIRAAEFLASGQLNLAALNWVPPREGYEQARVTAKRGLALNPNSGALLSLMASIHAQYDWDWTTAEQEVKRALALEPRNVGILQDAAGIDVVIGRYGESARLLEKAIAIDPLNIGPHWDLAVVRTRTERFDEGEEEFRKALEISPTAALVHSNLGWVLLYEGKLDDALAEMRKEPTDVRHWGPILVYYRMGRKAESDTALAKYTKEHADDDPYGIADAHAYRSEVDQAFAWLERAYSRKQAWLYFVKGNPDFNSIRGDPRYKAFLRKLNLPE